MLCCLAVVVWRRTRKKEASTAEVEQTDAVNHGSIMSKKFPKKDKVCFAICVVRLRAFLARKHRRLVSAEVA